MNGRPRISRFPLATLLVAAIAVIALYALPTPAPVHADSATFYLDCPTTEVVEGNVVKVYLVRVTNHYHDATFYGVFTTEAGTAGPDD